MKVEFSIKKTKQIDLEALSAGITSIVNTLGVLGRIHIIESDENLEFSFDTKDIFDLDENRAMRNYVTK